MRSGKEYFFFSYVFGVLNTMALNSFSRKSESNTLWKLTVHHTPLEGVDTLLF